jgi:BirA family biotin operon repressor/biotin-[acetyl-CoA-carboxylase] ligase
MAASGPEGIPGRRAFGSPRRHYRLTGSTNERARLLAEDGAPHGTTVTAAEQTAGRGRLGRVWTAPAGKALLCSLVLRLPELERRLLPLAVPLAVSEVAESLAPVDCRLKWPNDVWVDDKKLAGILIEARPAQGWAVIGVGLNVTVEPQELPPELRETATSLGRGSAEEALAALCPALDRWVEADAATVLTAYRERDGLRGRRIAWSGAGRDDGTGTADGIAADGSLLVLADSGERLSLGAGDVSLSVG